MVPSPPKKLGISGAKKFPNMKIIVHNKENNGDHKTSPTDNHNHINNNKKKIPLLEDNQNKHVHVENGNGNENVVKTNGTTTNGNGNGVVKSLLLPDNKRKHQHEDLMKELKQRYIYIYLCYYSSSLMLLCILYITFFFWKYLIQPYERSLFVSKKL